MELVSWGMEGFGPACGWSSVVSCGGWMLICGQWGAVEGFWARRGCDQDTAALAVLWQWCEGCAAVRRDRRQGDQVRSCGHGRMWGHEALGLGRAVEMSPYMQSEKDAHSWLLWPLQHSSGDTSLGLFSFLASLTFSLHSCCPGIVPRTDCKPSMAYSS